MHLLLAFELPLITFVRFGRYLTVDLENISLFSYLDYTAPQNKKANMVERKINLTKVRIETPTPQILNKGRWGPIHSVLHIQSPVSAFI